jgi:hypothetical protein|tara:strand:- start:9271 stop:9597 length:327 start_codon:yes stop_codon:yes gene_type:complete
MLSTEVRKKAEFICKRIAEKAEVAVSDMIWIQKWAKSNHSVEAMLRRARRRAIRGDQPTEGLDRFLEDMDLGDPDPEEQRFGPQNPVELAEWFGKKRKWFVDDEGCRD